MFKITKKRSALVVVFALVITAVAVAYWTTGGSGSGSGSVDGTAPSVTLSGASVSGLIPGGSKDVAVTAANASSSDLKIGAVTGTVSVDATHLNAGCTASNFSFQGVNGDKIAAGATAQSLGNGVLSMTNSASNQDACKGATVTVTLSAAQGVN